MGAEKDSDTEGWKQKYHELLNQLEARQAQWQAVEAVLRQGISRLALLAETGSPELDRPVRELRSAIREGEASDRLGPLIEQLGEHLRRAQGTTTAPGPVAIDVLLAILDSPPLPATLGSRAIALRKRIEAATEDSGTLAADVAALIEEAVAGEPATRAGLGRWLPMFRSRKADAPGDETGAGESLALAREILLQLAGSVLEGDSEEARLFREKLEAVRHRTELTRLAERLSEWLHPEKEQGPLPIHEVLLRLLERLEIPDSLREQAEAVKGCLVDGMAPSEVEKCLAAIADLITEMRSRVQDEKRNLESFLQQLSVHLQELDQAFLTSATSQQASFEDSRQLDAAVRGQVEDIEHSVRDATDLNTLQSAVRGRLQTIREHLQQFREKEEQRAQEAEAQVADLKSRLRTVEGEVASLREQVRRERDQAVIDPLTGIPNRLAYNERMAQEYARWRRYGHALCLAVWDVDRFKEINDLYGHQAGDRVLRVLAKVLAGNTRTSDLVARYGGEEFAMLLPETELESAKQVAEKLRAAVEQCDFHHRGKPVAVTISCGVAQFRPGDDPDAVFRRADAALYRAKAEGRNRCLSEEEVQ